MIVQKVNSQWAYAYHLKSQGGGTFGEYHIVCKAEWNEESEWANFLVDNEKNRSNTSVCLKITDPWFLALHDEQQAKIPKLISELLEKEGVAFDINGYRDAPPGLRLWTGATVQNQDIIYLLPWLDWAYYEIKSDLNLLA